MPAAGMHHSHSQVDLYNMGFFFLFCWAGSHSRGLCWWVHGMLSSTCAPGRGCRQGAGAEGGMRGTTAGEHPASPLSPLLPSAHRGRGGKRRQFDQVGPAKVLQRNTWQTCLLLALSPAAPTSSSPALSRAAEVRQQADLPARRLPSSPSPRKAAFPPCGFAVNKYPVFMLFGFSGI